MSALCQVSAIWPPAMRSMAIAVTVTIAGRSGTANASRRRSEAPVARRHRTQLTSRVVASLSCVRIAAAGGLFGHGIRRLGVVGRDQASADGIQRGMRPTLNPQLAQNT